MSGIAKWSARLGGALLNIVVPADCHLCRRPLPWQQRGGVCLPCWDRLDWSPGLRLDRGPLRAVLWAADYDGPLRRLIHGLKFEGMDYLAGPLGSESATRLRPLLWPAAVPRPDMVVPVPLHWWRRARRGYNQALLLARPIARRLGLPLLPSVLRRRRAGRRQIGLTRAERLNSLAGCMRAGSRLTAPGCARRLSGRTVLLVDDVVTTGATLEAAATALLQCGARAVLAAAVARTPRRGGAVTGGPLTR